MFPIVKKNGIEQMLTVCYRLISNPIHEKLLTVAKLTFFLNSAKKKMIVSAGVVTSAPLSDPSGYELRSLRLSK
jgi:hypothetical protein